MNGNTKNDFKTDFQTFCSILHENLLHNGKHHQIITLDTERKLLNYFLEQENAECSEELSSWVQQFVFCVVSDESQTNFELHLWDDELYQKKVVSLENYFVTLSTLYLQHSNVSLETFQKKVKEMYVLIPESVVKYFFDHFSDNGSSKKKKLMYARKTEDKENKVDSCKVICYDYIKKKVMKRKVITDKINKSSGDVISSKSHEEIVNEDFVYCLQKSEKLFDISNGQSNELSSLNYTASEPLEVKFLDKSVIAYFPPDEMQNHDHLVTFSNLIYCDQGISPEKSQTIQMEFMVPKESLRKSTLDKVDVDKILQEDDHSSYVPKKKSKKPANSRKKKKSVSTKYSASTPKLTIITDPVTKGATLKIDPNSEYDSANLEQQSFSSLFASATEEETVLESSASDVPQSEADHKHVVKDTDTDTGEQPNDESAENKDSVTDQVRTEEEMESSEKIEMEHVKVESIPQNIMPAVYTTTHQARKGAKLDQENHENQMHHSSGDSMGYRENQIRNHNWPRYGNSNLIDDPETKRNTDGTPNGTLANIPNSFECHICGRELKTRQTLDIHLKRHFSITKHICKVCNISYKDIANLRQHVNIHKGVFPYKCRSCDKTFPSAKKRLTHTVSVHQPARFHCDRCKRDFKVSRNFKSHMRLHDNLKPFFCTQCTARFNSLRSLLLHRTVHSDKVSKSTSASSKALMTNSNNAKQKDAFTNSVQTFENKSTNCSSSFDEILPNSATHDVQFLSIGEANKAILTGIPVKDMNLQYEQDSDDKANLDLSVLVSGGFQCEICLKSYTSHQNLKNHLRLHSELKLFTCLDCGQNFNWESGLMRHRRNNCGVRYQRKLKRAHTTLSCKICNKQFKSYKGCQLHIKRCITKSDSVKSITKENKAALKCSRCQKAFDSKKDFCDHRLLCSKLRSLKCSVCNKTYKSSKNLALHSRLCQKNSKHSAKDTSHTKHENLNKRDLGSLVIDSNLNSGSLITCKPGDDDAPLPPVDPIASGTGEEDVSLHVDCHNSNIEYFCKFCDSSFVSETKLKNHVSSHNTKATFKCGECDQRFPTKNICLSHMKRRHQLCRYSCTICKRSFRCKRKLKNHLKTHGDCTTVTNTTDTETLQTTTKSFRIEQDITRLSQSRSNATAEELFEAMQGNEQWTAEEFELEYN